MRDITAHCWGDPVPYADGVVSKNSNDRKCLSRIASYFKARVVYHRERNHQGLGNRLIDPGEEVGVTKGSIACRQRLGGLLRYYYRQAA